MLAQNNLARYLMCYVLAAQISTWCCWRKGKYQVGVKSSHMCCVQSIGNSSLA